MPNGDLISREAAIAAMKKATKEVGFNPFKVLDEAPEVDAVTFNELREALIDMNACCRETLCSMCGYAKSRVCSIDHLEEMNVSEFIRVYRKRKEDK